MFQVNGSVGKIQDFITECTGKVVIRKDVQNLRYVCKAASDSPSDMNAVLEQLQTEGWSFVIGTNGEDNAHSYQMGNR